VRIKLPGSAMICALLAVMAVKMLMHSEFRIPRNLDIYIQVALGIRVGMGYTPDIAEKFTSVALPVVCSTLVLVGAGLMMAFIIVKFNLLSIPDAYLSTSPGAMGPLISLSLDNSANPGIVAAFHFFRVIFIILTAPLAFRFLQSMFNKT
jgi:membrane AbrB-like protein